MSWRRIIDRYIGAELVAPFGLGLLIYTFVLLLDFIFDVAKMIIRFGVSPADAGRLVLYSLPNIVVLTIPMAFLFGILVAIGRLSNDSELTALRSSGVSLWRISRPVLWAGAFLTLANLYLMMFVMPHGNSAFSRLTGEIQANSINKQVEARVFYEDWEGFLLYVFDLPPGETRWKGVFLADTAIAAGEPTEVSYARWGELRIDPEREDQVVLYLDDVVTHKVSFSDPDDYHTTHYDHVEQVLEDPLAAARERARRSEYKGVRDLTIPELQARLREPGVPPEIRRLAKVEIHKKFVFPFACLVFALLGVPLAFNLRRGARTPGFVMSLVVIVAYYLLIDSGEKAAREGAFPPWLSMWLPNLLLLTIGLLLMLRRDRDRTLLPRRWDYWLRDTIGAALRRIRQRFAPQRRRRRSTLAEQPAPTPVAGTRRRTDVVLRLPRLRMRFPNMLDRYVLATFFRILGLAFLSGLALFVIAKLTNKTDEIIANTIEAGTVVKYLGYSSLQSLYEFAPIAVLITTLTAFGILSKRNEITAAKALGTSLYRLALPALAGAAVVAALSVWLQIDVLPAVNERAAQLEDQIHGRTVRRTYRRSDRNWLFGQGRYIYNYLHYDEAGQALQRLQVFEFDEEGGIVRRLFADEAHYVGDGWRFDRAWTRAFEGLATTSYEIFEEPRLADFPETPEYFESEVKLPVALTYGELKEHIREVEGSGKAEPKLRVALYNKIGYPVISLIMGLVALPFSFRLGRRGALHGVGVGIALGMVFLGVVAFATTLGENGILPPLLAVWSPAIAFTLLSLYAFLGVET